MFQFDNSYARLPDAFFQKTEPTRAVNPSLLVFNDKLFAELTKTPLPAPEILKDWFSGNTLPHGSEPIAQAYAGHQYGHFVPQLGDGRALLLGEALTPKGERFDIQLKGSGPTRFSRRGDGRAALGPMLREYLISEFMFAVGIPTTRSLAVVTTGENVQRDQMLPGAVLTRVALSHIRVGTFEFFAARKDLENLKRLAEYSIQRHDPTLLGQDDSLVQFFRSVALRQAKTIAEWMLLGFIHGVMNTDNMAISGETIDYGPCAFMDEFDLQSVFSSIDHHGRYAYGQQPAIGQWNLSVLGFCLSQIWQRSEPESSTILEQILQEYEQAVSVHIRDGFLEKLGLAKDVSENFQLVDRLIQLMQTHRLDFTNTFRLLSSQLEGPTQDVNRPDDLKNNLEWNHWLSDWQKVARLEFLVSRRNPIYIPRNHLVEQALSAAQQGQIESFNRLLQVVQNPYLKSERHETYSNPPTEAERVRSTFCGT